MTDLADNTEVQLAPVDIDVGHLHPDHVPQAKAVAAAMPGQEVTFSVICSLTLCRVMTTSLQVSDGGSRQNTS